MTQPGQMLRLRLSEQLRISMGLLSVKARPELAREPLWEYTPRTLCIPMARTHPEFNEQLTDKHMAMLEEVIADVCEYLSSLGCLFFRDPEGVDLEIRIYAHWIDPTINHGVARTNTEQRLAEIELNIGKIQYGFLTKGFLRGLVLHEIGHALGLVVTPSESAEKAGSSDRSLNHCRHLTCAMTHTRLAGWFRLFLAWLVSRQQTFCSSCKNFLVRRLP